MSWHGLDEQEGEVDVQDRALSEKSCVFEEHLPRL